MTSYSRDIMSSISPHLTLEELLRYLPHFDMDSDPQVGDWVMITPRRRRLLLDPLIEAWEQHQQHHHHQQQEHDAGYCASLPAHGDVVPQRYALSDFLPEQNTSSAMVLAPLSVARRLLLYTRKRSRPASKRNNNNSNINSIAASTAPTSTITSSSFYHKSSSDGHHHHNSNLAAQLLYLHVRLGLLTTSTPVVFGGGNTLQVVALSAQQSSSHHESTTPTGVNDDDAARAVCVVPLFFPTSNASAVAMKEADADLHRSRLHEDDWFLDIQEDAHKDWERWLYRQQHTHPRRNEQRPQMGFDAPFVIASFPSQTPTYAFSSR